MGTILLRIEAPMQSWGTTSKFSYRLTQTEPSKSGIIGLLSAALGRSRDEPVDDLVELRMIVRVDREGKIVSDYHTVLNVLRANTNPAVEAYVTEKN